MHICRIRYTVLGLLIYCLQNAFSSSCVSDFDDVASKTVMADIVFEGQFYKEIPTKEMTGFYNIRFNKIALIKGNINDDKTSKSESRRDNNNNRKQNNSNSEFHSQNSQKSNRNRISEMRELSTPIVVGLFGPTQDESECIYPKKSMTRGQRYLVFLSNPDSTEPMKGRSSSENSRRRFKRKTSTPPPIYRMSSFPIAATSSTRKEALNHNCLNCGKIPKIAKMTQSLNVTENKRVKITCRSIGFPKPEMYWLKNGLLFEPEGDITIKDRKQTSVLVIKNARDEDTGQYQCYALNVLGQSNLSSAFVNVMSKTKKPFSELCQDQRYCVNEGICYTLIKREHYFCQCAGDFIGERCEEKNTGYIALIGRKRKRHLPRRYEIRRYYPRM